MIDSSARIDSTAKIAPNVEIGPYSIIGPGVEIGEGTVIGAHVVISKNTIIGKNNKISPFAVLGGDPQHSHYQGEDTYLYIGDDNIIREFCTIHRGTVDGGGKTLVGSRNFLMAYTHVAHDCIVEDDVTLANNASLAGHVHLARYVNLSAFCGVHQHVYIGAYTFLGRATKVGQDIPPYMLVTGMPGAPRGLNSVGLKRYGFTDNTIRYLRRAYSVVYRQGLQLTDAIETLHKMVSDCPEIQPIIDTLQNSKRGLARKI